MKSEIVEYEDLKSFLVAQEGSKIYCSQVKGKWILYSGFLTFTHAVIDYIRVDKKPKRYIGISDHNNVIFSDTYKSDYRAISFVKKNSILEKIFREKVRRL